RRNSLHRGLTMSRIAKYPVALPKGVDINIASGQISVKGPLGTIARAADPNVGVEKDGDKIVFKALGNSNHANAMSGTMRALVANMVAGVTKDLSGASPWSAAATAPRPRATS